MLSPSKSAPHSLPCLGSNWLLTPKDTALEVSLEARKLLMLSPNRGRAITVPPILVDKNLAVQVFSKVEIVRFCLLRTPCFFFSGRPFNLVFNLQLLWILPLFTFILTFFLFIGVRQKKFKIQNLMF